MRLDNVAVLSVISAALSNIVSNVPAVLMFKPLIAHVANPHRTWLALAMSSTLAGNLTVLGSVANLIVVHHARRKSEDQFLGGNDPQFAEELDAIVGLYLSPPEHALLLCLDDKIRSRLR